MIFITQVVMLLGIAVASISSSDSHGISQYVPCRNIYPIAYSPESPFFDRLSRVTGVFDRALLPVGVQRTVNPTSIDKVQLFIALDRLVDDSSYGSPLIFDGLDRYPISFLRELRDEYLSNAESKEIGTVTLCIDSLFTQIDLVDAELEYLSMDIDIRREYNSADAESVSAKLTKLEPVRQIYYNYMRELKESTGKFNKIAVHQFKGFKEPLCDLLRELMQTSENSIESDLILQWVRDYDEYLRQSTHIHAIFGIYKQSIATMHEETNKVARRVFADNEGMIEDMTARHLRGSEILHGLKTQLGLARYALKEISRTIAHFQQIPEKSTPLIAYTQIEE